MDCLKSLDPIAIKALAEELRPGYTCAVDIPLKGKVLAGAYNVHVSIVFDDREEWLMRTPYQDGPSPPIEILTYDSEATTLRSLHEIGVPAPAVYGCGTAFLAKDKSESQAFNVVYLTDVRRPYCVHLLPKGIGPITQQLLSPKHQASPYRELRQAYHCNLSTQV
jgi:hypothetical protein